MTDGLGVRGRVRVRTLDAATGRATGEATARNMWTLAGRDAVAGALVGEPIGLTHMAIGTSGAAPAAGAAALGSEKYRDAITTTARGAPSATLTLYVPGAAAAGHTLREVGLFTAAGVLLARALLPGAGVAKSSSIALQIDWTVTLEAV